MSESPTPPAKGSESLTSSPPFTFFYSPPAPIVRLLKGISVIAQVPTNYTLYRHKRGETRQFSEGSRQA